MEQPVQAKEPNSDLTELDTNTVSNPFGGEAWSEKLPVATEVKPTEDKPTEVVNQPVNTEKPKEEEFETVEPNDWFKNEFKDYGWDSIDKAKAEIAEWKKVKENPIKEELKFENEDSKKIYEYVKGGKKKELREFLEMSERIETYSSAEVTDQNAEQIIKLGMKLKNDKLSKEEIDFQYKEEFVAGKEPVQRSSESDEEFEERKEEYNQRVERLAMKRSIAAKMAQPDLLKLKSELVLPDLPKEVQSQPEISQESLAKMEAARVNFLNKLNSDFSKFEGFNAKVKDESVEIPVAFKVPDEDKVAIKQRLEAGFDFNEYFDKRWFDEGGNPKIETIIGDIFQLENPDKLLSGIANNAANLRLAQHRKEASNINVTSTPQQTYQQNVNGGEKISPFSKNAWSEKAPQLTQN